MDDKPILVTITHIRICNGCANPWAIRKFLNRHELDARRFFREGLPVEDFESTGDQMAIDVARVARGRQ